MAYCNTDYFEQIGNIQKAIHERERRRHDLEEKLFAYLRSEERLTKMKYAKMRCYYKELYERERQAKTRNLELLGNVESLAGNLKEFSIDCSRLLQKRLEYKNHITKLKKDRKKLASREESETKEKPSRFLLGTTQGSSQSAVAFSGSSGEDGIITTRSPSRTEFVPNHPSLSPRRRARDVGFLSDDILNSADFLEGGRVSDMHDQQMESDISQRKGVPQRREDLNSTRKALKEAEVSSQTVTSKRPAAAVSLERCPTRSPSPDTTDPRDSSPYRTSRGEDEALSAEEDSGSALGHQDYPDYSKSRYPSLLISSEHEDSDNSVSSSQRNHTSKEDVTIQSTDDIQDPLEPPNRLCMKGFFHLLDSVERRLSATVMNIYQSCAVSDQKLRDIISICSQRGRLDDVDLQACAAVILEQLPLLCCNLPQRCLLSADLIHTHWSSATRPEQIRSRLSAEGVPLWDQCFRHMLHLQQKSILNTDLTVQIFTPLLVLNNASYTDKAGELLKRLLTYESDSHQPSESELSSSCSLASFLDDSVEIKPARPSKRYSQNAATQEIQSAEEDSADQSPVESIPIRETKAYQLLKQSVAQERRCSDTEEEDSESSDINKLERAEALGDSITQNSLKSKVQAFSAIHSKAFWGESDDSNSEIEMALRPQSHNNSDDFYD